MRGQRSGPGPDLCPIALVRNDHEVHGNLALPEPATWLASRHEPRRPEDRCELWFRSQGVHRQHQVTVGGHHGHRQSCVTGVEVDGLRTDEHNGSSMGSDRVQRVQKDAACGHVLGRDGHGVSSSARQAGSVVAK